LHDRLPRTLRRYRAAKGFRALRSPSAKKFVLDSRLTDGDCLFYAVARGYIFDSKLCTASLAAKSTATSTDGGLQANRSLNFRSGAGLAEPRKADVKDPLEPV